MANQCSAKEKLEEMRATIAQTAVACFSTLLNRQFAQSDGWGIFDRLQANFDAVLSLGCANAQYQGVITLSGSAAAIETLLQTDIDGTDAADTLGEIANVYCGMLMDIPEIIQCFGNLRQALPAYSRGGIFFPRGWCVQGGVEYGGNQLVVGMGLREVNQLPSSKANKPDNLPDKAHVL